MLAIVGPRVVRWLTRRLGWVGSGSEIFVFSGLTWVMGLKMRICEKVNVVYVHSFYHFMYVTQSVCCCICFNHAGHTEIVLEDPMLLAL